MKKVKSKKILPEDFMIRVNPHMNSKGKWNGGIELAIIPNENNPLDDDDYYQVEHICKMLCATLNYLEVEPKFRDDINDYVANVLDKELEEAYKDDTKKIEYTDNVIQVSFNKSPK
jgi:hypothetical protein|tara:strand:+ start:1482 stop:1829 length:348 start_codon:yes stop_codon:yes gene_type:complete